MSETSRLKPVSKNGVSVFRNVCITSSRSKVLSAFSTQSKSHTVFGWGPGGELHQKQNASLPLLLSGQPLETSNVVISDSIFDQRNLYHFYLHLILPFIKKLKDGALQSDSKLLLLEETNLYQKNLMALLNVNYVVRLRSARCNSVAVIHITPKLIRESVSNFISSFDFKPRPIDRDPTKRVYLARRIRRPSNQVEVSELAKRYGYQTLFFEDLDFEAQLDVSRTTSHWLADHGAGLVHIIWSYPLSLVEMVPPVDSGQFGSGCYMELLAMVDEGAEYASIDGKVSALNRKAFSAPLDSLELQLSLIHGQPMSRKAQVEST